MSEQPLSSVMHPGSVFCIYKMYQGFLEVLFAVTLLKIYDTRSTAHIVKREAHCPVFKNSVWEARNRGCPNGKQYHCFEDENANIVADGCFVSKQCFRGAHPVVEGKNLVCNFCRTGFQPVYPLNSTEYRLSFCTPHSPDCNPSIGEALCREGSRVRDRACTCSRTLGFRIDSAEPLCQCFTPNDACNMCTFVGCEDGYTKNGEGYCEPAEAEESTVATVLTLGSTTTERQAEPQTDDDLPGWAIALIAISCLFVLCVLVACLIWKKKRLKTWCMKKPPTSSPEGTDDNDNQQRPNSNHLQQSESQSVFIGRTNETIFAEKVIIQNQNYITIPVEKPSNQHTSDTSSSLAQESMPQSNELVESVSEPMEPSQEETEPLLPTAPPSGTSTPPSDPPLLGPHPHPSSSDPSALLAENMPGPVQPGNQEAVPFLPSNPPCEPMNPPSGPTSVSPVLGPHLHSSSSDPSAMPLSSPLGTNPTVRFSSPALEPSAPPPSLQYQDGDQDGVKSDSETTSVTESSGETAVKQIVQGDMSEANSIHENQTGPFGSHRFNPNMPAEARNDEDIDLRKHKLLNPAA